MRPYPKPDLSKRPHQLKPHRRQGFFISAWAILLGLVWVSAAAVLRLIWLPEPLLSAGLALSRLLAGFAVCFLVAAVLGMLSRPAGNVFFLLLTGATSAASTANAFLVRQQPNRQVVVAKDGLERAPPPPPPPAPLLRASNRPSEVLDIAAEAAAAYAERVEKVAKVYEEASKDAELVKAFEPDRFRSREEIQEAKSTLEAFERANQAMNQVAANYESLFRAELQARYVSTSDIDAFMQGPEFQSPPQQEARKKRAFGRLLRAEDQKAAEASGKILDLMLDHYGKWTVRKGKIRFRSRRVRRVHLKFSRVIKDAMERRKDLEELGYLALP